MIIAALSTFMSAAMTLAQVSGTYEMSSTGSCLYSTLGFKETAPPFTPNFDAHSKVWGATTMATATWTFDEGKCNGTASGTNYAIDFPPGGPILKSPDAHQYPISFTFDYTVIGSVITITPSTGSILVGTVSADGGTLTIPSAYQVFQLGAPMGTAVCNTARVLIRVGN